MAVSFRQMALLALALPGIAAPAHAQSSPLTAEDIHTLGEMQALADVCPGLPGFSVRRAELDAWMARRMARLTEEDQAAVIAATETKVASIARRRAGVDRVPEGFRRDNNRSSMLAAHDARCTWLTRNNWAEDFFRSDR